jgi:hypothetical protein
VENYRAEWKELVTPRVVHRAEDAVSAIEDVFEGRVGSQKVVIEHPLL